MSLAIEVFVLLVLLLSKAIMDLDNEVVLPPCSIEKPRGSICSLHDPNKKCIDAPIILFNDRSLQKCQAVKGVREFKNLKYGSIVLPESVDDQHGYHMECYRRFIALPKAHRLLAASEGEISSDNLPPRLTRSRILIPKPCARTGIFPPSCIFCGRSRKKVHGREVKLINGSTKNFESKIRNYMAWKNDKKMMARLQGVDFSVKEIKYHGTCRVKYQLEAEKKWRKSSSGIAETKKIGYWYTVRDAHKKAFNSLAAYLQDEILSKNMVIPLSRVKRFYIHLLKEYGGDFADDIILGRSWNLRSKVQEFFKGCVVIKKIYGKDPVVYGSQLLDEDARKILLESKGDQTEKIIDAALILRHEINNTKKRLLPDDMKLKDVERGEVDVPEFVKMFFEYLIGGPTIRERTSQRKQVRVKSIGQDVVFAVTSGRKKPAKHLMLGLALKSMTGSRKLLEVLNRLGHCASYHTVEETETELTYEASKYGMTTPYGMKLSPGNATGLAWDNFDRYVDTESGKDTLHDTVGISYQIVSSQEMADLDYECADDDASTNVGDNNIVPMRKRRRSYEPHGLQICPYAKKPKMSSSCLLPEDDERRIKYERIQPGFLAAWKIDVLWMTGFAVCNETSTPMWTGWNCLRTERKDYVEKIWYLPQINQTPTSRSVIAETMNRSVKVMEEAGRGSIVITYDLAIAKIAFRIQEEEAPKYDQVFVALGGFHIEMAFFSAMGKVVAESGGPDILNACSLLAPGSLKSFLRGKNYKRCRKMHEVLALSFEILHFKSFLNSLEDGEELAMLLTELATKEASSIDSETFISAEIDDGLERYAQFCEVTRNGEHGKTARFWFQYVDFYHLYHTFSRSIRVGDLDLYMTCLPQMANVFFALNHLNYGRWLVRYWDNLLKLPKSHPEVFEEFKKGHFAITRSRQPFSSTPIDLALEQTINADAASQKRGISSMTNSISARQRWSESHFLRTAVVSKVLSEVGMSRKEDCSKDLRSSKMKRDNVNVRKVVVAIKDSMNPFDTDSDKDHLFNIVTGKALSTEGERYLLNINEIGQSQRKKFTSECYDDPSRFERRIQSQRMRTFATEAGVKKLKSANGRLAEACLIRDIFGSLLCYSLENHVDISEVLKYPLSPVPLALCHTDGTPHKSQKSTLMNHLESRFKSCPPPGVDVTIVDAAFFLHLHQYLPSTYGGVSRYLLSRLMEEVGMEIHFVSDKWIQPSIKGSERKSRMTSSSTEIYAIDGVLQKRPSKWLSALQCASFKKGLLKFLIDTWCDDGFADIFGEKTLYANLENECFKYVSENGSVVRTSVQTFHSTHEEADNRMFFHLSQIDSQSKVVVRTNDTDCLIIALGCKHQLPETMQIWLEVGVSSNNSHRFIDVNGLHAELGNTLCKALPVYHAFTGCDYTASFNRKGKVAPFKVLEKDITMQHVFGALPDQDLNENVVEMFEQFICRMYGQKKAVDVDDARSIIFFDKYRIKPHKDRVTFTKKLDGSALPPCRKVVEEKVKRTYLVAKRWVSALLPYPPPEYPEEFGWKLHDGEYDFFWFAGEPTPKILDITCDVESPDEVLEDCSIDVFDDESSDESSDDDQ